MVRPQYRVAIQHDRFDRLPTDITIVVVHHGGPNATDDQRVGAMALALQTGIIQAVRPVRPDWTNRRILQSVYGFLSAENIYGGAQSINNGDNHRVVSAEELDPGIFIGLLLVVQESNADIELQDLRWTFHLDPMSFAGGRGKPKKPGWVQSYHYPLTWEDHSWLGEPIPCAAFALVFAMQPPPRRSKESLCAIKEAAHKLALKLGWRSCEVDGVVQAYTATPNDLSQFVLLPEYTHYRVTVLVNHFDRCAFSIAGPDFVYDAESTENLIYLFWDTAQSTWHYAALPPSRIQSWYRALRNCRVKFCHKCTVVYQAYVDKTCDCHEQPLPQPKPKKPRTIDPHNPCRTCGKVVCAPDCTRTCSLCLSIRGRDHRCVVWSDPDADEQQFWTPEDGDVPGEKPRLWVYDLEASIDATEIGCRDFVRTPDGASFVLNDDGSPQVFVSTFQQHKVNLVVARCVFSGQEFVGNTVVEFLIFLKSLNGGNHVCIAHNGSGYDTRHIMDAALRCNPVKGVEIIPLNRGCKFLQMKIGTLQI